MGYLRKNCCWIIIGVLLTAKAVQYAYEVRGYMAYGGEWMVLPFILQMVELIGSGKEIWKRER